MNQGYDLVRFFWVFVKFLDSHENNPLQRAYSNASFTTAKFVE